MKSLFVKLFQFLRIYHPLQLLYRSYLHDVKRFIYRLRYKKYKGSGLLCNACGQAHQQFVDDHPSAINVEAIEKYHVVAGYGENIVCPYCLSIARERLVLFMLENHFELVQKKVLHCSPEKKIYDYLKLHAANVVTADLYPGFYRRVDPQITKQDLLQLDAKDETYDMVIANHVMEHIPNDSKALQEIYRVLKHGGQAILQVPFSTQLSATIEQAVYGDPISNSKNFGQKDHVRIYALHDYVSRLEATGFQVAMMKVGELSEAKILALQEEEVFFMITKS